MRWSPGLHHAASFYLPAIALAARETGEQRWQGDLETYLTRQLTDPKFTDNERGIWWGFKQGGLLVLKDLLGDDTFDEHFTPDVLDRMHPEIKDKLAEYDEPGMLKREHPESAEPGFEPYMKPGFDRNKGFGFPRTHWVHGGRQRPRHEAGVLAALAGLGVEGAAEAAARVLSLRQTVPTDFTHTLHEDYETLPPAVHLYARSVGATMLDWWRNVWLLRKALHDDS